MGTFGPVTVRVPRARLETSDGKTAEWKNATIPAYQRRTKQADALIAFAAAGRVRVFATDHGCVRGWSVIDAEQWERALKLALGDAT